MADQLSPREDAWRSLFHAFQPSRAGTEFAEVRSVEHRQFHFFAPGDLAEAVRLAAEFDQLAGPQQPENPEALAKVMARFHEIARTDVGLAQWALRLFIAGRPGADILPMPTLRQQMAVHLKERKDEFAALVKVNAFAAAPAAGSEDLLNYYRHDLDLSDHHLHWHMLYPFGRPRADLQGRLFLFMHQQMLARYNTERFAAGLTSVEPFLSWSDKTTWAAAFGAKDIPVDPLAPWINGALMQAPGAKYIDFDEQGAAPAQNDPGDLNEVITAFDYIVGQLKAGGYASYNALGADLEASALKPELGSAGPHNLGHMVLATPPGAGGGYFVMADPEVAMTTPVFYRWHRVIDDLGFAWQEAEGPDAAVYKAPSLTLRRGPAGSATRSPDIIITPRSAIAGMGNPGFDLQAWGETNFGGANFAADAPAALNVDELITELKDDPAIPGQKVLTLKTDWTYPLRLSNPTATASNVTVRIWLAAQGVMADRRNWIEMDKFVATVPANSKKVVVRGSWQSAVVRAKSVTDPNMLADTSDSYDDTGKDHEPWCECGLPYRLLLPRGSAAGMPSRFLILLTDADEDNTVNQIKELDCGSVTFCAKQNNVWPDRKEMGFPFHRPFAAAADPVFAHFDALTNAAWRDISIRAI